jgi:hypothetical protein
MRRSVTWLAYLVQGCQLTSAKVPKRKIIVLGTVIRVQVYCTHNEHMSILWGDSSTKPRNLSNSFQGVEHGLWYARMGGVK